MMKHPFEQHSTFFIILVILIGAIVLKDEGAAWYAITLIVSALPSPWLGGKVR